MKLPAILVAIFLLSGYATACVSVRRRLKAQRTLAHPVESVFAVIVLIMVFFLPSQLREFRLVLAYVASATVAGILVGVFSRSHGHAGTREFEVSGSTQQASVWKRWLGFSRAIADYEVRLILGASYLVLIGPLAIAYQMAHRAKTTAGSTWQARTEATPSLDVARRPF
jgi:hypothetical protein